VCRVNGRSPEQKKIEQDRIFLKCLKTKFARAYLDQTLRESNILGRGYLQGF
jgi:hypothetical protein